MKKLVVLFLVISALFAVSGAVYAESDTYTIGQYTLNWSNNDTSFNPAVKQKMIDTFFTVYPELVKRFNPDAPTTVNFISDKNHLSDPASTSDTTVTYQSGWLISYPNDTDVVVHEITHIIQSYTYGNTPGWMTEGMADYVRYKYGLNNSLQGWTMQDYAPTRNYTDGYGVTARFLLWLEIHVRPTIVDEMDSRIRTGAYSDAAWVDLTGQTIDQLWSQYAQNPSLTGTIAPNGDIALYKTATASGYVTGSEPSKAVGGIVDHDKWYSTNSGDKWLSVDLGQNCNINRWVVKHAGAGGETSSFNTKNFKLQASTDGNTWTDIDTITGNTSNITDRVTNTFTARYVRVYITQGEQYTNDSARIYEFEVYGISASIANNVALYKSATADGNVTGESPDKAVDGTTARNSKWCSTNSGNKWLKIDLGKNYTISRWKVLHAAAGGETADYNTKNFKLQGSTNGSTWTDIDTVTGNTSDVTDRSVSSFTARYVRLYITQSEQNANGAARIYEFEVYGQ